MVWMCFILHSWIFLTKIASLLNLFDFKKKSSIYFMSKLKHYFGDQLITRENLIFQEFKCINFNKNWQISNFCNQTHTYQNGKGNKKYLVYHLPSNLYKEASGLSRHVKTVHENARPFTCLICTQSFGDKVYLKRHVETVHENCKPFTCLICNKSFGRKGNLKIHVKTVHENTKPLICLMCMQSFRHHSYFKMHVQKNH